MRSVFPLVRAVNLLKNGKPGTISEDILVDFEFTTLPYRSYRAFDGVVYCFENRQNRKKKITVNLLSAHKFDL